MNYYKQKLRPSFSAQISNLPSLSLSPSSTTTTTSSSVSLSPSFMSYNNLLSSQSEASNADQEKSYCSVKYMHLRAISVSISSGNACKSAERTHQRNDETNNYGYARKFEPTRQWGGEYDDGDQLSVVSTPLRHYSSTLSINLSQCSSRRSFCSSYSSSRGSRQTLSKIAHRVEQVSAADRLSVKSSSTSTICNYKCKLFEKLS
jgi:hypothetical protein